MQTNILDWLEATSARCPDAPAVGDEQTDCTWAQLTDTARRAGSFLASRTMPRRPVAFYLEKSVFAFAAMLGTVYAGCCYSVLDTRQPAARTLQVLDTLTPALLVTDEAHAAAAAALGYSGQIIQLDDLLAAPADAALLAARRRQAVDVDPLYINFTSGSTGVPKGVTVSHRSVLDFIPQFAEIFGITQNDILGNQAPFDFDVSVKDLYTALYTGAKVQIIPRAYFSQLDDLLAAPADAALLAARRRQAVDVDPLYINFTSGSTGVPKGVTVSHRSVLDFIPQFAEIFGITQNDILGNQAPFDFDVSVKDLYTALYTGAKVQIIPRAYFSQPTKLMDYLADHEVTILVWAVSAMCFVSIMNGFSYRIPSRVRQVLFSGEVMPIKHLMKWKSALPHARFVNLYGPTEITCNCTYAILPDRDFAPDEALPIGRAFPNEKVFLLDENDTLVTVPGQAGEICVSGTALALGYYADPVRTAQAFTQNPLNTNWYERIYRTGDLARYDESGSLYYIGRRDFQIKHMGHRVELGEIEAAAMRCDAVTRACCTFDAERQRLHLFYTGSCEKAALLAALKESLPPFMQPNTAVQLDEMPLNKNGKIDRTALAALTKKGAHK